MPIRTVRKPGEKGTQRLVEKYGTPLVCIRYRYDAERRRRYKTVELIIAAEPYVPGPPRHANSRAPAPARRHTPRVPVRISYQEKDLQRRIKTIGGNWEPNKKRWYAPEGIRTRHRFEQSDCSVPTYGDRRRVLYLVPGTTYGNRGTRYYAA